MRKLTAILLLLLPLMLCKVSAEKVGMALPFTAQHLPQHIRDIFFDSDGYAWYRTNEGLYQDDGYRTTCYRADIHHPDLIRSNYITCITEDAGGNIWFGTKRGAYIIDKRDYSLTSIEDEEVKEWVINTLDATRNGEVWLSTNERLIRYDKQGKKVASYPINQRLTQVYEDNEGVLWRIVRRENLARYVAEADSFIPIEMPYKQTPAYILQDRNTKSHWVSVWGRGIIRYTATATTGKERLVEQRVTRIVSPSAERKLGKMVQWGEEYLVGHAETGYLHLFELTGADTLRRIIGEEAERLIPGVESKKLENFTIDSQDRLWLIDAQSGVSVVTLTDADNSQKPYKLTTTTTPDRLFADNEGYWLMDEHTRKYGFQPVGGAFVELASSDKIINAAKCNTAAGIYAVRKSNDLIRYYWEGGEVRQETLFTYSLGEDEHVRLFHEDAHGNFWLGTNKGIWKYDIRQKRLTNNCPETGIVIALTSLTDGTLIISTEEKQLLVISPDGADEESFDLPEACSRLLVSSANDVWATTNQGGIYRYEPAKKSITSFTREIGLTGNTIMDAAIDNDDNIWLLYERSLIVFNPQSKSTRTVRAAGTELDMEHLWSLRSDPHGNMHIGGTHGIVRMKAEILAPACQKVRVPLYLTAYKTGDGHNRIEIAKGDEAALTIGEENVELYFSTLNLPGASRQCLAWRKQGGDDWTLLPAGENSIKLMSLSGGNHYIEVRATTPEGVWSDSVLTVKIHRALPWYQQKWLWALLVLLVVAAGAEWTRRVKQRQRENMRIAEQLAEEALARMKAAEEESDAAMVSPTSEEEFLNKIDAFIEQHLTDSDYSVEDLANDMFMSRANLHRKIKAATGTTPVELMRIKRLQRAVGLLKEGKMNVSEIAYAVGFSTPSYFTQAFKKQYGILPTKYK
ncbi:MAG: helix-turn-helix domain-containing protein [Bacteroidaceae bacterium]|nr:helix-turn-helix domain-containing protein [Bacteroidaceae bacterium]